MICGMLYFMCALVWYFGFCMKLGLLYGMCIFVCNVGSFMALGLYYIIGRIV